MTDIHAYRKIVELQQEIVRLSRQNGELEQKCQQLQAELILQHRRLIAKGRFKTMIARYSALPKSRSTPGIRAMIRSGNFAAVFERVWHSILS